MSILICVVPHGYHRRHRFWSLTRLCNLRFKSTNTTCTTNTTLAMVYLCLCLIVFCCVIDGRIKKKYNFSHLSMLQSFFFLSLHKIGCTRQFVSKLTLRSFALPLHKIGCTRQFVSELTLRSFALSLQKIG